MKQGYRVRPILLWGMMGAGKSALARHLCETIGLKIVDLDQRMHAHHGEPAGALITRNGLEWFRREEREILSSILDEHAAQVIALGGGTLLEPEFRAEVRSRAYVCTLTASPKVLYHRLRDQTDQRPLLGASVQEVQSNLTQLLAQRQDAYLDSDCIIDTSALTVAQTASLVGPLFLNSEAA